MKKIIALLLAVMMTMALIAACTPAAPPEPSSDNGTVETPKPGEPVSDEPHVFRIAHTYTPDTKNPITTHGFGSKQVFHRNVYEKLLNVDENMELCPWLAQSWEVSADNLTWVFHLRQDVTWHDGEAFNADDVVYTYETIQAMQLGLDYSALKGVVSIEKVDEYTVAITTEKPKADMISAMVYIVPEHIFSAFTTPEEMEAFANEELVGTGPFKFDSSAKDEFCKFVVNENYYGDVPEIDELIYVYFANSDTIVQAFEKGEIDFMEVGTSQVEHVEALEYAAVHRYSNLGFIQVSFNCWTDERSNGNPLILDPVIRKAIDYSIDKEKIIEYVRGGYATLCPTIVPAACGIWSWDPGAEYRKYDIEKAKAVLEGAGYVDADGDGIREDAEGNKLDFRFNVVDPDYTNIALIIQAGMTAIGINTTIQPSTHSRQSEIVYNQDFDTDIIIWGWGVKQDPSFILNAMTSAQIGQSSDCFWSNAEYDELYLQQLSTINTAERVKLVHKMQQIIYEENPYIPLFADIKIEAYRADRWTGFREYPNGSSIFNIETIAGVKPAA